MELDPIFLPNNLHHESASLFANSDPHLRRLRGLPHVHRSPLLNTLPSRTPGIYSIGGGRQVGKTTLLKQWITVLLDQGVLPPSIGFFTGKLIDDHHALIRLLQNAIRAEPASHLQYIVIDEVTYIDQWDRGIKYLADIGLFDNAIVILTGSDLTFLKEARMRFPGRRGKADVVDFHLYPLSFGDFVDLKGMNGRQIAESARVDRIDPEAVAEVFALFEEYLAHGGYLPAINDMAAHERILPATLATYAEWLRGDILKRGKHESLLRELLAALIEQMGSQVTWHSLTRMTSIDHHRTVSDYVEALESMDAVFVQSALAEDRLAAAPKKARKITFTDPFIFHSARSWVHPVKDPFRSQIKPALASAEEASALVEATVVSHYRRFFPCYYIKAQGEVDLAYVRENRFFPVEVKWTRQVRPGDLSQVRRYPQAVILGNVKDPRKIDGIPVIPLPLALLRLCVEEG